MNLEVTLKQAAILQDLGGGDATVGLNKLLQFHSGNVPALQFEFLEQHIVDNYNIVHRVTTKTGRIPFKEVYGHYQVACSKNGIDPLGKTQFRRHLNTIPGVSSKHASGNVLTVFGLEEKPL